ncbi:hypothetical protein BJX76DRAFT_355565 [Aspergillus varians]
MADNIINQVGGYKAAINNPIVNKGKNRARRALENRFGGNKAQGEGANAGGNSAKSGRKLSDGFKSAINKAKGKLTGRAPHQ